MATNSSYKAKGSGSKAKGVKADKHSPKAVGKTSCPGCTDTNGVMASAMPMSMANKSKGSPMGNGTSGDRGMGMGTY